MSNYALITRVVITICFTTALGFAAYIQLFNSRVALSDDLGSARAQAITAATEAIRNAAIAQPHKFGIEKTDVHTLRVTDSVPSAKTGVRHVYLTQEINGIPISNTLLSTIVKQDIDDGSFGNHPSNNYVRTSGQSEGAIRTEVVNIVSSKQAPPLIKNAETCVDTNAPTLTAEEALSVAVKEMLGVNGASFRRRVLEEVDVASKRQKSVFEADDLLLNDTPCQLAYWSVSNNHNADNCNIRLSWSCIIKPTHASSTEVLIDASKGTILHVIKFGEKEENKNFTTQQQQADLLRRRLSTYSAVPYPNENPCPSCVQYSLTAGESKMNIEDIEPLSLVMDPEYLPSSPKGWLTVRDVTYDKTQGNNARAAFNVNEGLVDFYDSGETVSMTDKDGSVFDYSDQDVIPENMLDSLEAAVTNAFYWTNIMHDILYQYGFTEESGNFQEENFGFGGKEGDSVVVEVKETQAFNNAVFLPTVDGARALMILFIFLRSDAKVVLNVADVEYTAAPAAFGPTEYNITGAPVIYSNGIECEPVKDKLYKGAVVLIDRGTCVFTAKVNNAQKRGAVAVIVADDVYGPLFSMQGTDTTEIPAVSITKRDGNRLKQSLPTSNSVLAVENPELIIRDSAFDNGIIIHEYCHGLTTRLTGGASNQVCIDPRLAKETGSEGWSDFCTLFVTATNTTGRTRTIGSFASWSIEGIRIFPYSTDLGINPSTYSFINAAANAPGADATHFVGTIFATVLWDMYWAIIDFEEKKGRLGFNANKYESGVGGSNIAMQLVVEGLKTQPCYPSFVDSRDAILISDLILYDEEYKCVIWESFARRGLGASAVGSTLGTINVEEGFDVPEYCLGPYISQTSINYTIISGDYDEYIDNCEFLKATITLKNTGVGNLTSVHLVELASNSSTPTILNELPMQLIDLPERASTSIDIDFIVDGLMHGEPLELEAKFSAAELTDPILVLIVFDADTSTDLVMRESVTWDFKDSGNNFTAIDGYFSLEASRTVLTVDGVPYYSPTALFGKISKCLLLMIVFSLLFFSLTSSSSVGPQNFSLVDLVMLDGQSLECEPISDDKYSKSVVLIDRGECDFADKVSTHMMTVPHA